MKKGMVRMKKRQTGRESVCVPVAFPATPEGLELFFIIFLNHGQSYYMGKTGRR